MVKDLPCRQPLTSCSHRHFSQHPAKLAHSHSPFAPQQLDKPQLTSHRAVQLREPASQRGSSRRSLEAQDHPLVPQQGMPLSLHPPTASPGIGQYRPGSHRTVSAPNVMQYSPDADAHIPATSRRAVGMPFIPMPPHIRQAMGLHSGPYSLQGIAELQAGPSTQQAKRESRQGQSRGREGQRQNPPQPGQNPAGQKAGGYSSEEPLLWRGDRPLLVHVPAQVATFDLSV